MTNNSLSAVTTQNQFDYEILIKSLTQGNYITKAECLKRLTTLVATDKKQFPNYAKRVVLALQNLIAEPKVIFRVKKSLQEELNLLASSLALEIINLNPKEIEYYIRSKLLKSMVKNLGDSKPQVRKISHYCLLAYVKTNKSFEQLIPIYISVGVRTDQWQLRQKSINSLQSIIILEIKYLNWDSPEFKKLFEILLLRLKDDSAYVQKAAEQCLVTLSKMEEVRAFSKTLTNQNFNVLKQFCEAKLESGTLQEIKIYNEEKQNKQSSLAMQNLFSVYNRQESSKSLIDSPTNNHLNKQRIKLAQQNSQKIVVNDRIQQVRKKSSSTMHVNKEKMARQTMQVPLKKAQSLVLTSTIKKMKMRGKQKQSRQKISELKLQPIKRESIERTIPAIEYLNKEEKAQIVNRKMAENMKHSKDWRIRLQALEDFQVRFQANHESFDIQSLAKLYMPILLKLLGDSNFKVALLALKIIQELIQVSKVRLQNIVPYLMQRLSDNKIALRQNVSKLIRSQYIETKNAIWIDGLLSQLKQTNNSNTKEQILSILTKLYQENQCATYSVEKIIEGVCHLMQDLKTKIKIRTLDLLVLATIKSPEQENIKNLLTSKLNQVYFEMYTEKVKKELSINCKTNVDSDASSALTNRINRASSLDNRNSRYNRNPGNTTSSSLHRGKTTLDPGDTVRTSSFIDKVERKSNIDSARTSGQFDNKTASKLSMNDPIQNSTTNTNLSSKNGSEKKKSLLKSFRKKTIRSFDKTNYSNTQQFEPFNEPQRQLKDILVEIKSSDWQICLQALNKTRVIIANHRQLLTASILKSLVPDIVHLVENLRSSLSKNAVITLNDMSNKVKRALDPELENIYTKLIKKSLDTNSFISEEVKKVMVSVCSFCNQNKVIALLMSSHTSKAIPIKTMVINILENIVFLSKFYQKQIDKVMIILNHFMNEGSLEIRQKTKKLLNQLLASEKGSHIQRLIAPQHLMKLHKAKQQKIILPEIGAAQNMLQNTPIKSKITIQGGTDSPFRHVSKRKKQKISVFSDDFNKVEALLQKCQSSDWKTRSESMTEVSGIYIRHPEQGSQYKMSPKLIDILSKQISDPNVKVATNALKIFKTLTQAIPSLIESNLSVILNQTFNCFASQKQEVRMLSQELFDEIAQNVEKWMLLQHMCNGIMYGLQKSKHTIIQKLRSVTAEAYQMKPNIFHKNVFPMINKTVEENKPDLMPSVKKLLLTIYDEAGQSCMDSFKPKTKQLMSQ